MYLDRVTKEPDKIGATDGTNKTSIPKKFGNLVPLDYHTMTEPTKPNTLLKVSSGNIKTGSNIRYVVIAIGTNHMTTLSMIPTASGNNLFPDIGADSIANS